MQYSMIVVQSAAEALSTGKISVVDTRVWRPLASQGQQFGENWTGILPLPVLGTRSSIWGETHLESPLPEHRAPKNDNCQRSAGLERTRREASPA